MIGGALLGLLIYIFPPLYGEGYTSLESLLTDNADTLLNNTYFFDFREYAWIVLVYVVGLVFIKVVATALTTVAAVWAVCSLPVCLPGELPDS